MTRQVPHGPEDLNCPKWLEPMSKVCHKCPLWVKMEMAHPQEKGVTLDEWNCAMAWQPQLLVSINNNLITKIDALQVELNELRNETKTSHDHNVAMGAIATQRATDAVRTAFGEVIQGRFEKVSSLLSAAPALLESKAGNT